MLEDKSDQGDHISKRAAQIWARVLKGSSFYLKSFYALPRNLRETRLVSHYVEYSLQVGKVPLF